MPSNALLRARLLAAAVLLAPCVPAAVLCAPSARAADAAPGTAAQPELPKQPLTIIGTDGVRHAFSVEMASTPAQQETGLMFRTAVPPDQGMLFDWGTPRQSMMWMKNTLVPLDMLFISADGVVSHIAEDTVPHSLAVIDGRAPARATLELAAGTAQRLNLTVGAKVEGAGFGAAK
ncbi:MAG: DUF192 domain-containing protein [Janthinobacterium lividum]